MNDHFSTWSSPPEEIILPDDEVHVWRVSLDVSARQRGELEDSLSTEERERADRFKCDTHKHQFSATRGYVRKIIGGYLNESPADIQFSYSPQGKPVLAYPDTGGNFNFNVSHSHEVALFAFCLNRRVGVDIEQNRTISHADEMAERFFSPREYNAIRSLSPNEKQQTFLHFWTLKEAYLKATGEGLSGLQHADIFPGKPLTTITDPSHDSLHWSILSLEPVAGYVAAVAVEGLGCQLRCFCTFEDFQEIPV